MKVPWRIEMGAVVGGKIYLLDRPALSVRKILGLQPLEELQHARQALLVIDVLDRGMPARRIGRHVILQRHGNVDQLSRHGAFSVILVISAVVVPLPPFDAVLITYDFGLEERSWQGSIVSRRLLLPVVSS